MEAYPKHIVFIDGECALCNRAVLQIDKRDKKKILHYASLSSVTAQKLLPQELINNQQTFVFLSNGKVNTKSIALFNLLSILNNSTLLQTVLKLTPTFISDFFYNCISFNRTRFSKRLKSCIFDDSLSRRILK